MFMLVDVYAHGRTDCEACSAVLAVLARGELPGSTACLLGTATALLDALQLQKSAMHLLVTVRHAMLADLAGAPCHG